MGTTVQRARPRVDRFLSRTVACLGVLLAVGLATWEELGHSHGTDESAENPEYWELILVFGLVAAATAIVFGVLVPRALREADSGMTAIVLSTLGLLAVAVFWSGLPPVLAAGGIVLGSAGWNAPSGAALSRAAVLVGVLAIIADLVIYIAGMTT
jgi:hypothetical protein